jgi:8-oxo-dGTP pyrophosphatase MutT (NUDIX family)
MHVAGQIAFPGGKLLEGESALAAVQRESMEEVGVDLKSADVMLLGR